MSIIEEFKRMKTTEFWKRVRYWSAIKWTGKKTETVAPEDWLPILTSALIGFIFIIIFVFIWRLIIGK
ncbi:MAG: hypothetical protein QMD11_02035 [Smithella sp.]|nr:hypothetical protein [Smithella sp.]